ncbi:MAG: hypothetical protein WC947_03800 [Elusimicrobiota bacterium]
MKQNIFFKSILFVFAVIASLLIFFYVFQFLPAQKKLLNKNLFDRAKTIYNLSGPIIVKAIETKDDLLILSQIENIMKLDDISTVYILDSDGKVITHDRTAEWGKIYGDEISKKAGGTKKELIQKSPEIKGYLYSVPLTSSATLCVGLSQQKTNETFDLIKKNAFYSAITVLIAVISIFAFFIFSQITSQFIKLENILKSVMLGTGEKIDVRRKDEFGKLSLLINKIINKLETENITAHKKLSETQKKSARFIQELSKHFENGLIVTNFENKIILANQKAKDFLSVVEKDPAGKHILEIIKTPEFIDVLKRSAANVNKLLEEVINNKTIKIITVGGRETEIIGTIIIIP